MNHRKLNHETGREATSCFSVPPKNNSVIVVGGGPAGLRVAECLSQSGLSVKLLDHKASLGRKFLVAGRGGLNISHSEAIDRFQNRYSPQLPDSICDWGSLLKAFSTEDLRQWLQGLGFECYVGSSGRLYPQSQNALQVLDAWITRLRSQKVEILLKYQWMDWRKKPDHENQSNRSFWEIIFEHEQKSKVLSTSAIIFALGGASWKETGSNGAWTSLFEKKGIQVNPWQVANIGWNVPWPSWFLEKFEGKPLKNIRVGIDSSLKNAIQGDLMITRYGLEGTPIYTWTRTLREESHPTLWLDLKPDWTSEELLLRFQKKRGFLKDIERCWKIDPVSKALLIASEAERTPEVWAQKIKSLPLPLQGPRPLDEAISSAGGVALSELDSYGMLKKFPGIFCVGEMIDWEAPTGGYLLQGCLSQATHVARGVMQFLE